MQPRQRAFSKNDGPSLWLLVLAVALSLLVPPVHSESVFPGRDWESIQDPQSAGFSSKRLAAVRSWLESIDTTALMVVVGGRTLFAYGDLTHLSYLASGRKSVLALLYGTAVENGSI